MLFRVNSKQEQVLLYLYEFRNTPERGVGPDPRVTATGIAEGTQIKLDEVKSLLPGLIDGALVRPNQVGLNTFYHLTVKGLSFIERVQQKSFNMGIDTTGISLGFRKSEIKGKRTDAKWEDS